MEYQKPSLKNKLGFSLGHVLNDMCASMWFTYLLLYFNKVLEFSNIYSGILMLIGQLADGFSTVFVGIFADKGIDLYLCNKLGQRKAWHLIGVVCVMASFPFIFSACPGCSSNSDGNETVILESPISNSTNTEDKDISSNMAQLAYYATFIVIFQFGWASTQIAHLAAIPDLSECQNERTGLTAIRYSMTVISTIMVYSTLWIFLEGDTSSVNPADGYAFTYVMLVCMCIGLIASIGYHILVKFPDSHKKGNQDEDTSSNNTSVDWSWFREYQLYQIGFVYMATRLYVNLAQAYIPFFLQSTLDLQAYYVATVPLAMYVGSFITSFAMKPLNKVLGRKLTFILGGIIGISGCLWITFCTKDDENVKYYVYFATSLIGIGGSTMMVTSLSLTAEFIGNDTSSSAFIYGLMSLTDKISNGLVVVAIQTYIPLEKEMKDSYIRDIITYVCGGSGIFGMLVASSLFLVTVGVRRVSFTRTTSKGSIP